MTAAVSLTSAFNEASVDRFGFGRNWLDYQTSIDQERILGARRDIEQWLGTDSLAGLRVLDIGSGSGLHSFCMHAMGARELVSFDYDEDSVTATREFHTRAGAPSSWTVTQGSVLDTAFIESLGTFDLVYSWGVLHHTGQMWQAIRNATTRVAQDGRFFISIYAKGPAYAADLELKQRYHNASLSGKRKMEFDWIMGQYAHRARSGQAPDGWWTEGRERGMDAYYDLVDWLGGLPYEVATVPELVSALRQEGIDTTRYRECGDGGCHILVARRRSFEPIGARTPSRDAWPADGPVVWLGAFDAADAPERVVPLARALPHIPFVMLAGNYAQLDADSRQQLEALSPNLRILDRPADDPQLLALIASAAVLLHTADAGPSAAWMTMAAAVGAPVLSVRPDAAQAIRHAGLGLVADGDLNELGRALGTLQSDAAEYARCSQAVARWGSSQ
jgi:2-polyprenyl-6-hydroxyphenyl methylase/3-demethylubiquinone-9 3-methyltransferase